jgi:glycogen debranching enzyme
MEKPILSPSPGARGVRFVGDRCLFRLSPARPLSHPGRLTARLRTNLGRGRMLRREIIDAAMQPRPPAASSWHDIPMIWREGGWELELALTEVGFFRAKGYLVDERGWQVWPEGPDIGLSVHPDHTRCGNTIYCAFTRMFGPTRTQGKTGQAPRQKLLQTLEREGYAVLPPSGTFRDLRRVLPHIVDDLQCHILHLLPVNPTPTTFARFGRFGSPYAALDLTAIDLALVEFDRRTTAVEQFCELAYAVHARGARLFLDVVVNHTGWGAALQNEHPEWYARNPDGTFRSPGAWGVTWEDLAELEPQHPAMWEVFAEALLTWCRRGVDGFRCDAGYKVPMPVWQYIAARVREEYPETVFLLEGLGGGWADTENLLTDGGMQWAYSELFQEHSAAQVSGYLEHALKHSQQTGILVHYSETHDNPRLAAEGRDWSLLRHRLCGLVSVNGAFGFTCGAEWLAPERIQVHSSRGLAWGAPVNVVEELGRLNRLLRDHPCFFDGAWLERLSPPGAPVYALLRVAAEGEDAVLVLVNNTRNKEEAFVYEVGRGSARAVEAGRRLWRRRESLIDLLGQAPPESAVAGDTLKFRLPGGGCYCLALTAQPVALAGAEYRRRRAVCAWAVQAVSESLRLESIGAYDWKDLARWVAEDPVRFLGALPNLNPGQAQPNLGSALKSVADLDLYPAVVTWRASDRRRIFLVPDGHWLLVWDRAPFRWHLDRAGHASALAGEAVEVDGGYVACCPPRAQWPRATSRRATNEVEARLRLERYGVDEPHCTGSLRFLGGEPAVPAGAVHPQRDDLVLLTNQRGAMARIGADLGRVRSKYDCVLAANLHPDSPIDRHVFVKRIRLWAVAEGFISPLTWENLDSLAPASPVTWTFRAHAGDGRQVVIRATAQMVDGANRVIWHFEREPGIRLLRDVCGQADLRQVGEWEVRLTVRVDLEDRSFHWETQRNAAAEHHFTQSVRTLAGRPGFVFTPTADRGLIVVSSAGDYHPQPEWSERLPHPVEQTRGQTDWGDAYSPGWFEVLLQPNRPLRLLISAEADDIRSAGRGQEGTSDDTPTALWTQDAELGGARALASPDPGGSPSPALRPATETPSAGAEFAARLTRALDQFVARRGAGRTVIAGYPWFLDWGRDTLICARGLIAAGRLDVVEQLVLTFGQYEQAGTLPNSIHGEDTSNRETSDAPLWYAIVCEELHAALAGQGEVTGEVSKAAPPYSWQLPGQGRTVAEVLGSIARHYVQGIPQGVSADAASGLIWSPAHFTWMDTNYPAGTPREGYPVEIQALWIRLLRQLERLGFPPAGEPWRALAGRADASLNRLFWLEDRGYYGDVLLAPRGTGAIQAVVDRSLRSNMLLLVSLGLVQGPRARRSVAAAQQHLVVPGALRSLAPLKAEPPLAIRSSDGRLLNNPDEPYWGRYEGDEDTCRKPAYHNGTAWTWTFPTFCEALVVAWGHAPKAVAAARSYLTSVDSLLTTGCLGHLPEIVDGDAPHQQRGCDAQAWGVSEALRVWQRLSHEPSQERGCPPIRPD